MKDFSGERSSFCPLHGYIPYVARGPGGEVSERELVDHPWVQRLRQIHQLQTAWWVFPTAEHSRFQHVLGSMHLASRAATALYPSLAAVCPDVPSGGYVESLLRMAALLHDVGHGPFGHFFDAHCLAEFGLTHETLGAEIVERELGDLLRGIRRTPNRELEAGETLQPNQIAFLITRPRTGSEPDSPRWLVLLRSLFCGIYTVDNLDFVRRDAFMSGYSATPFDLDRLLRYSFFTDAGLTIHRRGLDALLRFMQVRAQLFRSIYFHRTVRAVDLTLSDLFARGRGLLLATNPLDDLAAYQGLTDWSLLVDVSRWSDSDDPRRQALGPEWQALLRQDFPWRLAAERNLVFGANDAESASLFSDGEWAREAIRQRLPPRLASVELRVDVARHIYRPHGDAPAARQNFLYRPGDDSVRPLTDDQLFRDLPISHRLCRVYVDRQAPEEIDRQVSAVLDRLFDAGDDDTTNM